MMEIPIFQTSAQLLNGAEIISNRVSSMQISKFVEVVNTRVGKENFED